MTQDSARELRFDNRVALVTGAGRGLGRAYAMLLAARGCRVVVNDVGCGPDGTGASPDPADEVCESINKAGGEAVANSDDMADADGARAAVEQAITRWGRIDILVNNAGIAIAEEFGSASLETLRRTMDAHFGSALNVSHAAWNPMRQQGYGRIVNISSAVIFGIPRISSYAVAKGAILGLTKALAAEGAGHGIKVNAVLPVGATRLMSALAGDPRFVQMMEQWFPPHKVAPAVVWLAHEDLEHSGELLHVGGGHVSRVFLGMTTGTTWTDPTPEAIRDGYGKIANLEGCHTPTSTNEALGIVIQNLGIDLPPIPEIVTPS